MQPNLFFSVNDIYGIIVCVLFSIFFFHFVSKNWIKEKKTYHLFLFGFFIKVLAVIGSAYFNLYIVKADSTKYFASAVSVSKAIKILPLRESIKIFYHDFSDLPFKIKCFFSNSEFYNLVYDAHKTIVHVCSFISLLCFDSYIGISFFLSLWAYVGIWLIYKTFYKKYPESQKLLYLFIVIFPSLVFWTTGVMKEPVCIGAVGFIFYFIFNKTENKLRKIIIIFTVLISLFLLLKIKSYVFYALFFAFLIMSFAKLFIKNNQITRVLLASTVIIFYFFSDFLQEKFLAVITDEITGKISTVTSAQLEHGSSCYDLGELSLNGTGLFKYSVSAINVTLFRPYLWEYKNPLVLVSAFESLLMLLAVVWILFRKKTFCTIKYILKSPVLLFSLFFIIFLAIMVGGIAFNYGTLARYKTPLVPFFSALLIVLVSNKELNRMFSRKQKINLQK